MLPYIAPTAPAGIGVERRELRPCALVTTAPLSEVLSYRDTGSNAYWNHMYSHHPQQLLVLFPSFTLTRSVGQLSL